MPSLLLATCADLPGGDEDGDALVTALAAAGVTAEWAVWTDEHIAWDEAPVVIRSTWDYHDQLDRFRTWTASVPRLHNAAEIVGWSTDKVYLRDLAAAGVPIVPSAFFAPGQDVEFPDAVEFVVKPSVGAGSRGAGRFSAATAAEARAHAAELQQLGRTVLVQPFLDGVDTAGETALLYAAGTFSHAIRKGPMLTAGSAHAVDAGSLFIAENITARVPEPAELEVGEQALAAVRERFGADPLYARVDLLPGGSTADGPVVTELELCEPSLFLGYDAAAAARFATAIAAVA